MTFICTLDPSGDHDIDVIDSNGEYIVRLAVGFDPESQKTYSLAVALSPQPGGSMELTFNVMSVCQHSGEWHAIWDGLATGAIFSSRDERSLIRAALMACVALLVEQVRPPDVNFVTHTANLPDKALTKFWDVQRIFSELGYHGGRADQYHGRYIWIMTR